MYARKSLYRVLSGRPDGHISLEDLGIHRRIIGE
jgi:hypothetical protein